MNSMLISSSSLSPFRVSLNKINGSIAKYRFTQSVLALESRSGAETAVASEAHEGLGYVSSRVAKAVASLATKEPVAKCGLRGCR